MFSRMYDQYKKTFDFELMLRLNRTTYAAADAKAEQSEEWF